MCRSFDISRTTFALSEIQNYDTISRTDEQPRPNRVAPEPTTIHAIGFGWQNPKIWIFPSTFWWTMAAFHVTLVSKWNIY